MGTTPRPFCLAMYPFPPLVYTDCIRWTQGRSQRIWSKGSKHPKSKGDEPREQVCQCCVEALIIDYLSRNHERFRPPSVYVSARIRCATRRFYPKKPAALLRTCDDIGQVETLFQSDLPKLVDSVDDATCKIIVHLGVIFLHTRGSRADRAEPLRGIGTDTQA